MKYLQKKYLFQRFCSYLVAARLFIVHSFLYGAIKFCFVDLI